MRICMNGKAERGREGLLFAGTRILFPAPGRIKFLTFGSLLQISRGLRPLKSSNNTSSSCWSKCSDSSASHKRPWPVNYSSITARMSA